MTADAKAIRQVIRDALQADGIPLGEASLSNGSTTPALTVGDWEGTVTVTGLEVIVARNPQQEALEAFAFPGFIPSYTVRLINWSGREDLEAAVNAIAERFWPLAQDPALIPESAANPEQLTIAVHPPSA